MSMATVSNGTTTPTKVGETSLQSPQLKPLNKAGHPGSLTSVQQTTLADFEKKLEETGALPDANMKEEEQRATVLL